MMSVSHHQKSSSFWPSPSSSSSFQSSFFVRVDHEKRTASSTHDQVIRSLVEKEQAPRNQVDIESLLATFEKPSSRQKQHSAGDHRSRQQTLYAGSSSSNRGGGGGGGGTGVHDDRVDESQPSVEEVLEKFRKMEKKPIRRVPSQEAWNQRWRREEGDAAAARTGSLDRKLIRKDDRRGGDGMGGGGVASDSSEPTPIQIQDLVAKFSLMESRGRGKRGSGKSFGIVRTGSYSAFKEADGGGGGSRWNRKEDVPDGRGGGGFDSKTVVATKEMRAEDVEVDLPEEGTVQSLVEQWKALEKPKRGRKKKPKPSDSSVIRFQPSPSAVGQTKMTTSNGHKITKTPQNSKSPPSTSSGSTAKETKIKEGKEATARVNQAESKYDQRDGKGGREDEKNRQNEEEEPAMTGITKNMAEKFQLMDNYQGDDYDSLRRRKDYKWMVKESTPLGRPSSLVRTEEVAQETKVVAETNKTTAPSKAAPSKAAPATKGERVDFPDVIDHPTSASGSTQWNDASDELPPPSLTKNLLAQFESMKSK